MPFHVYCWEPFKPGGGQGREFHFINLDESQLVERILSRWDDGRRITWGGKTVESLKVDQILVFETDSALPTLDSLGGNRHELYSLMAAGADVTDRWIEGPAGDKQAVAARPQATPMSPLRDPRRVMVVHGRNLAARDAVFTFLRALGLSPIEWDQAVSETGSGSPHNLEAVRAAMEIGQAVVVILTAEDRGGLLPELALPANGDVDDDVLLRGQPRQNVILEAGLAMGVDRQRTILVELVVRH